MSVDPSPRRERLVSVLVCTRNRGANALPTVRSILACEHKNVELFLLDQSDADDTRTALAGVAAADPRFRYERMALPGKARALNCGLALARGQIVMLTDDDCEVAPGWIDGVLDEFDEDPEIGCVFGRVEAAPHDPSQVFVPICSIESRYTLRRLPELLTMPGWGHFGMGANMSLRAEVLAALQGWDECIGPGAKFGSGDDHDLSVRLLRAGYPIRFSPQPCVIHFGFRPWQNAGRDHRRVWFGVGGVFAKHLRCGVLYPGAARVPTNQLRECVRKLLRGSRPYGISYVASWLSGFAAGLAHPVDRSRSQFVPDAAEAGTYAGRVADVVLRAPAAPASHVAEK
jgi:GT2 family glycosyltransferase